MKTSKPDRAADPAQAEAIVSRYNRYVEYRKTAKKTNETFSSELNRVAEKPKRGRRETLRQADESSNRSVEPAQLRPAPRLARGRKITNTQAKRLAHLAPTIEQAARRHNVPVELICGVILQESGGNSRAVSHCGARGLMQLMPGTAKRFGVKNSFDPAQNVEGGTKYLRWLLDRFDGDIELALAGYNSGEHNVEKYGNKIPPFKETQNYVPSVLSYTQSMIDIFTVKLQHASLPGYARKA